ncbi:MAG TPA: helical backbone metal receptor, partial [Fimbriimonas sp.]
MLRAVLWMLLPVLLFAGGCRSGNDTIGGVPRKEKIDSIVSLSPSTTEILLTQGATQFLKGRTAACNYPDMSVKQIPIVASVKPDFEKIATIKPDLVVFDSAVYNEQDVQKIKELGAQTFTIDADTIDEFTTQLYRLGSVLGLETNVSGYVDKILAARTSSLGDPISPAPKVAVLLAGWGSAEHMLAGSGSFIADVVRASGGEPIGPDSDKFETLDPEYLLAQNPDIVVLGVPAKDAAATERQVAAVLNDGRFAGMSWVKNRRIIPMDQDV